MQYWILTVIALESKLEAASERYTELAEQAALAHSGDTFADFERVIEINDKKRRIVNMKVLGDRIAAALSESELSLLKNYTVKSATELESELGMSRPRIYRALRRAEAKAVRALSREGYDKARMDEDYMTLTLTARTYAKIKRLKSRRDGSGERKPEKVSVPPALAYSENYALV